MLATTSLDVNNVVRREMGVRKASFARAEPRCELTGMEIGGVTPFGLPAGLPVLVDGAGHGTRLDRARRREPVLEAASRPSRVLGHLPSVRVIEGLAFVRG